MASGLLWDELWHSHNDLHNGIHVTAVAEVMDACESRTMKRLQLTASLLQNTPLPYSLVHVQLQLCHCLLGLQQHSHLISISTKYLQCLLTSGNHQVKHKCKQAFARCSNGNVNWITFLHNQSNTPHSAWSESRGELYPREGKKFWGAHSLV